MTQRRTAADRLREWYRGRELPSHPMVIELPRYEQPPLAKGLGILGRFWLREWKWIITVIAIPLLGWLFVG